ncbi:hypothetical protein QZH41_008348, partial [Actinostola sp. cb2023]
QNGVHRRVFGLDTRTRSELISLHEGPQTCRYKSALSHGLYSRQVLPLRERKTSRLSKYGIIYTNCTTCRLSYVLTFSIYHIFKSNILLVYYYDDDDMMMMDELESLPFPNEETDFSLPDEIFESSRKSQASNTSESPGASDAALLKMKLQGLASNTSNVSTPDSSPKRKRTRQVNSASSSQPSSPHPAPSSAKRRR